MMHATFGILVASLWQCQVPKLGDSQNKYLGEIKASVVAAPTSSIRAVAVAPDGKSIAYTGNRGTVVVSFPDGKVLHELDGDRLFAEFLAFTPNGKWLVGANRGLRVWDLATGKLLVSEKWDWERIPKRRGDEPRPRPAISPDGKQLYVGGEGNEFRVIEVETGKQLQRVQLPSKPASSFAPSADGKTLAVATAESLILFRTNTFAEFKRVALPQDYRTAQRYYVTFANGSQRLFVLGPSKDEHSPEVRVWSCEKGDFTVRFAPPVPAIDPELAAVAMIGVNRYALVSSTETKAFGIYDLQEEKYLGMTGTKLGGVGPLALTPDGKHLIGGLMSDNLIVVKVEDVLKLIPKDDPPKKP